MRHRRLLAALFSVALLVGAACGDDDDDDGEGAATTQDTETTTTTSEAEGSATVSLRETSLGSVLVDDESMTLYVFARDEAGTSNCNGPCAETWRPLTAEGEPTAGDGVDRSKLSTVTRADGSTQVAYGGRPLYRYAPDAAPGETTGQGVGGVWYVIGADATPITTAP